MPPAALRACLAVLFLIAPGSLRDGLAQLPPPAPPGPYVVDLRGATVGLPQGFGFYPALPDGTQVPARGFGVDVGGHVYFWRLGPARLGLGANLIQVRGTTRAPAVSASGGSTGSSSGGSTPAAEATPIDIDATSTLVAPQVSFNFGTTNGWSYLSAGIGTGRLTTNAAGPGVAATGTASRTNRARAINMGGGARWFVTAHVAVGFDVRLHMLAAGNGQGGGAGTPGSTVLSAAAGFAFK